MQPARSLVLRYRASLSLEEVQSGWTPARDWREEMRAEIDSETEFIKLSNGRLDETMSDA